MSLTAEGSLVSYLNKYLDTKLEESVTITIFTL